MKILSLSGANLASLTTPFHIDFNQGPLANTGLFAITGNTGAGKSTLLDAICLALYDEMPRFNSQRKNVAEVGRLDDEEKLKANDVRGILSRGHASGFAQVVFRGSDQRLWQAHWSIRRARQRADGRFQGQERSLTDLASGQVFSGSKRELQARIDELVGLSWEQFRRAVILPQGEFAAFLKSDANERSALLERMTGTELYSTISMKTYERNRQEQQLLTNLNQRLADVALLDESTRIALLAEQSQLEAELNEQKRQLADMQNLAQQDIQITLLEQSQQEAEQEYQTQQVRQQQSQAKRKQLYKAEQAQVAKPVHDELARLTLNLNLQQNQLSQLTPKLNTLNEAWQQAKAQEQTLTLQKIDAERNWGALQPELKQAQQLDTRLAEKRQQWQQADAEFAQQQANTQALEQQLVEQQGQLHSLTEQQQKWRQWLNDNDAIAALAPQWRPLLAMMQNWAAEHAQQQKLQRIAQQKTAQLQQLDKQLAQINTLRQHHNAQQQALIAEHQALSHGKWDEQYRQVQQQWQLCNAEQQQWQQLSQLLEHSQAHHHQLQQNQQAQQAISHAISQLDLQLARLQPQLARLQIQQEEAHFAFEQAQASAHVEQFRPLLKPHTPCPLCGACEHPYMHGIGEQPQIASILAELRARAQHLTQQYQQCERQLIQYDSERQGLLRNQQQLNEQHHQLSQRALGLAQHWHELGGLQLLGIELPMMQEEVDWDSLLQQLKQHGLTLQYALRQIQQQLSEAEQALAQLTANQQQLNVLQQQTQRLDGDWQQGQAQRVEWQTQLAANGQQLDELTLRLNQQGAHLDEQMGSYPWRQGLTPNHWQQWQTLCESYLHGQQQWQQLSVQINQLTPTLSTLQGQLASQQQRLHTLAKHRQELNHQHQGLQASRQQCLAGQTVEQVEQNWQAQYQALNQALTQASQSQQDLSRQHSEQKAHLTHIEQDMQQNQQQKRQVLQQWVQHATQLAMDEYELRHLLSFSNEQRQSLRDELQTLDEALTQAQAKVAERSRVLAQEMAKRQHYLAQHRALGTLTHAQLQSQIAVQHALCQAQEEQLFNIKSTLLQAEQNAQSALSLTQAQQAQQQKADHWQKMCDLIGQANGAKFRTFAQSLTLERLLLEANEQLTTLAPRYHLEQVPGSDLALQVVDLDMGDEVRSVDSLSGGESFLVSLALALALSSLSASQTQVESLFIDEGFGTLDPESLDIALASLDALQASGRQIGVISHVQSLVERIGVQIRLEAKGGGESQLHLPS